jgi:hypothetical protein
MAMTVRALVKGGQIRTEEMLGWDCGLIRKGEHERKGGMVHAINKAENAVKSICRICSKTSAPSWMGKAKPIHRFVVLGCTVV